MWRHYYRPATLEQALQILHEQPQARIVAGGTDLTVELRRGVRPTDTLVDLTAIAGLRAITLSAGVIEIGALATHNDLIASPYAQQILPLAQASREVGAPQIRAAATIAGNLVTASPANDTITALIALDAQIELVSLSGSRVLALADFYQGVRRTVLQPGEIVRAIRVAALHENQRGLFLKLGLRRAQAISVVNAAMVLSGSPSPDGFVIAMARIALGCVAPTIVRCAEAEQFLVGRVLDPAACAEAGQLAVLAAHPIDDVRATAAYRCQAVAALVEQGLTQLAASQQALSWEAAPVLLEVERIQSPPSVDDHGLATPITTIHTTINGAPYQLAHAEGLTLLDTLREVAGLTGTKEGCAEGECGACTVWLNGRAVMSCLTPAAQAAGGSVTTIEGLAHGETLHPVQQAFITHGAVQCGFCTPGFVMSAAQLLAEHPHPSLAQVQTAVSGNLCRCTGYQQITQAILDAATTCD